MPAANIGKAWTPVEDEYLLAKFKSYGVNHCARKLNREPRAVLFRVKKLGLSIAGEGKGAWSQTPQWLQAAVKDFVKGTGAQTPHEAIEKGERTLEQWCDFLETRRVRG